MAGELSRVRRVDIFGIDITMSQPVPRAKRYLEFPTFVKTV